MSAEANKAILRRLASELSRDNLSVIDDVFGPGVVDHGVLGQETLGVETVKHNFVIFHAAFSNLHYTIDELLSDGDRVAVRWTVSGIHDGEFAGISPTGQRVTLSGTDIFQIVDGKVIEFWEHADILGLLHQLGAALVLQQRNTLATDNFQDGKEIVE